jgi:DNA-binding transcriptional regulator YiaG
VNKTSVQHWERNEVKPARWIVPRLREFLGLESFKPPMSFAEKLTAYRRGQGLSQEALARMLAVHKTTVVRWETGRRHPLRSMRGGSMLSSLNHVAPLLLGTKTKRRGPANQGSCLSAAGVEPAPLKILTG